MASAGKDGESLELNLTPMLDIFSILVTFLLMSYSTDPINHDVDELLELPDSVTIAVLDEVPTITVNRNEIRVNDKKITVIVNGDVPEKDREQGAIYPLFKELEKIAELNKQVNSKRDPGEKKKPGEITMEMDKEHNFKLMKRVMLSAQQAEFITFKLMVSKPAE